MGHCRFGGMQRAANPDDGALTDGDPCADVSPRDRCPFGDAASADRDADGCPAIPHSLACHPSACPRDRQASSHGYSLTTRRAARQHRVPLERPGSQSGVGFQF